ncbi:MAG TPA: hypothetical protein VGD78_08885 [Chthoniobacterales bacterium]
MLGTTVQGAGQEISSKLSSAPASFEQSKVSTLDLATPGTANHLVALDAGLSDRESTGTEIGLLSLLKPQRAPSSLSVNDNRPATSVASWSAAVGKPAIGKLSALAVDESGKVVTAPRDQTDSSLLPHADLDKFALVPTNFYSLVVSPSDEEDVWVRDRLSNRPLLSADTEALLATVFGDAAGYSNASLGSSSTAESLLQVQMRPVRAAEDLTDLTTNGNLLANNGGGANLNVSTSNLGLSLLDHGMMTQMTLANQAGNAVSIVSVKNVAPVPEPSAMALIACAGVLTAACAGLRRVWSSAA